MTRETDELYAELSEALEYHPGEHDGIVAAQRARFLAVAPQRRFPVIGWRFGLAVLMTTATAAAFLWLAVRPSDVPLRAFDAQGNLLASGAALSSVAARNVVQFSDDSEVELERGAIAHLAQIDADRVEVSLSSGTLKSRVTPRAERRGKRPITWVFRAGPFQVRVLGTQLAIRWVDQKLSVGVTHGEVRVSGGPLRDGTHVKAGQRLVVERGEERAHLKPLVAEKPSPAVPVSKPPTAAKNNPKQPENTARRRPKRATPRWLSLAQQKRYRAAALAAETAGLKKLHRRLPQAHLALLADSQRLAGMSEMARSSFLALRRRFPKSHAACIAAYHLGSISSERNKHQPAAHWYQLFLRGKCAQAALEEDALGRLIVALKKGGDDKNLERAACRYAKSYPQGAYSSIAKALCKIAQ